MDDVRCGPGMVISSCGTYHEAVFTNGTISVRTKLELFFFFNCFILFIFFLFVVVVVFCRLGMMAL